MADAHGEAERMVLAGQSEYQSLTDRSRAESERMVQAGRDAYDRAVNEARSEQARLLSQTEVVQAAHAESTRIVDEAHAEADRQRGECDAYVDGKLAEFSELLATTLRTVDSGRNHLRAPATMGRNGRTALYDYQG